MTLKGKFFLDLLERTFFTYLEVVLGLLIASATTDAIDLSVAKAAAIAAIPAALAVVKSALSSMIGTPGTASALPTGSAPADPGRQV